MKRGFIQALVLLAGFVFVVGVLQFWQGGLTGFAVFQDSSSGEFNLGTYSNTEWNGSAVVLSSGQSSGTYYSDVFETSSPAVWNNLSWVAGEFGELPDNAQGSLMSGNILLMHLNEGSGTISDSSGEGNDGTYNGVLYGQSGKLNDAIGFDGNNDLISTPVDLSGLAEFTISAWYYRDSSGDRFDIAQSDDNNQDRIKLIRHNAGDVFGVIQAGSSASYATFSEGTTGWKHIVMVFDGSGGSNAERLKMYSNGVEQSLSFTGTIPSVAPDFENDLKIGYDDGSDTYGKGRIDEVAVWDRSLSAEEVLELYTRSILSLDVNARSCDDDACSGESWDDIGDVSPQDLSLGNNAYFQYGFSYSTEDSSYTPWVSSVSVDYDV
ncbi:MAG: LamG domain-containing protein, partial [Nanoarchaeota archaeon]|nr:LamG domain-containing protein [Nanoarchaeota archaeon]